MMNYQDTQNYKEAGNHRSDTIDVNDCFILNPNGSSRITRIKGWADDVVYGLEFFYNGNSNGPKMGTYMPNGLAPFDYSLQPGEDINEITGYCSKGIQSIIFYTTTGRNLKIGSSLGGSPFCLKISNKIVTKIKFGINDKLHYIGAIFGDSMNNNMMGQFQGQPMGGSPPFPNMVSGSQPQNFQNPSGPQGNFSNNYMNQPFPNQNMNNAGGQGGFPNQPYGNMNQGNPQFPNQPFGNMNQGKPQLPNQNALNQPFGNMNQGNPQLPNQNALNQPFGNMNQGNTQFPNQQFSMNQQNTNQQFPPNQQFPNQQQYPPFQNQGIPNQGFNPGGMMNPNQQPPYLNPSNPMGMQMGFVPHNPSSVQQTNKVGFQQNDSKMFDDFNLVMNGIIQQGKRISVDEIDILHDGMYVIGIKVEFKARDSNGNELELKQKHVGLNKNPTTFQQEHYKFSLGESITEIYGRAGSIIDQLYIRTSNGKYFGGGGNGGQPFSIIIPPGKSIVGFGGAVGGYLSLLFAYLAS